MNNMPANRPDRIVTLRSGNRVFELIAPDCDGPRLLYWGPANAYEPHDEPSYPPLASSADKRQENALFPLIGDGFFGEPALAAAGGDSPLSEFTLDRIDAQDGSATLFYQSPTHQLRLTLSYKLDQTGILKTQARLENVGAPPLHIHRLNALTIPLPCWAKIADLTYGGWSQEGHNAQIPLVAGKVERTGRAGRPGFDGGPHLLLKEPNTSETSGKAIALALAYSGNHTLAAETFAHGLSQAIIAEWLHPGEVTLESGATYETPIALAAISTTGLSAISAQFHALARDRAPTARKARPVQLNSWEAVYFGVDEKIAMNLATEAASLGAERFVLDDGWFKGRHHDRAGLGDWVPDPEKFPNGLAPLADHVTSLGMQFGLWFEPEMINEDSDLYRAHPDWIIATGDAPGPTGRNQLVLDLSKKAVRDYLFDAMNDILSSANISYIKWDCNRDLFPAATQNGPTARAQISGLYELLARLRAAHPAVAIESCASGGGRMDFGVLDYADRFWTSDSTDPVERTRIQRRASLFYPVEMLGAHVGASPNHWTGRSSKMPYRCLAALFGHFGVELHPAALNAYDREVLKRAIKLYKDHRSILIDGAQLRFDTSDPGLDAQAILSADGTQALLRILRSAEPDRASPPFLSLPGFAAKTRWHITELAIEGTDKLQEIDTYSSEWLDYVGLDIQPPHSGQGRIFLMEKADAE